VLIAEITTVLFCTGNATYLNYVLEPCSDGYPSPLTAQMRNFFKQTLPVVGTLLGLFIFLGLGTGGLLLLLIAVASRDTGRVKDKSVLVLTCPKHHRCETNSGTSSVLQEALTGEDNNTVTLPLRYFGKGAA